VEEVNPQDLRTTHSFHEVDLGLEGTWSGVRKLSEEVS
jgi:hypothetical protein